MQDISDLINQYGFPIVAACGMGYMIYYVWGWATKEVKPVLSETNTVLIALVDRVRSLDNDLVRLHEKVEVVTHLRAQALEREREQALKSINAKSPKDQE